MRGFRAASEKRVVQAKENVTADTDLADLDDLDTMETFEKALCKALQPLEVRQQELKEREVQDSVRF